MMSDNLPEPVREAVQFLATMDYTDTNAANRVATFQHAQHLLEDAVQSMKDAARILRRMQRPFDDAPAWDIYGPLRNIEDVAKGIGSKVVEIKEGRE